jgi:hypothetical protein
MLTRASFKDAGYVLLDQRLNNPWGAFTARPTFEGLDLWLVGRHVDNSPVHQLHVPNGPWKGQRIPVTNTLPPSLVYGAALPTGTGTSTPYVNGLRLAGDRLWWCFRKWYDTSGLPGPSLGYTDLSPDGSFSPVGPLLLGAGPQRTSAYLVEYQGGIAAGCGMAQNGSGSSDWGPGLHAVGADLATTKPLLSRTAAQRLPMPANYFSLGVIEKGQKTQYPRGGCSPVQGDVGSWKSTDHCYAADFVNGDLVCFTSNAQGTDWYGVSPLQWQGQAYEDPADSNKGDHATAYAPLVQVFSGADLAAVAAGQKNPWDVLPYLQFDLRDVIGAQAALGPQCLVTGCHYLADSKTLILSVQNAERDGFGVRPVLRALQMAV